MPKKKLFTSKIYELSKNCAAKVNYVGDPDYLHKTQADTSMGQKHLRDFLQVKSMMRLLIPGGEIITECDYEKAAKETLGMIEKKSDVTIYEAAAVWEGLAARMEVVLKRGKEITLVRIRQKAYDPSEKIDQAYNKDSN